MKLFRLIAIGVIFGVCWFAFQIMTPTDPAYAATDRFLARFTIAKGFPWLRRYHLFEPTNSRADDKLPLVVVLHGASQRSTFSTVFAGKAAQNRMPSFVLAPEAAFYRQWATPRAPGWEQDNAQEIGYAVELAKKIAQTYPVDLRRIYVVGASQGGSGVFGAFARYPNIFAAGVSYAGGWDIREPGALRDSNIWALHGLADKTVSPNLSANAVEGIRQLGGKARLTLLHGQGHGLRMSPKMAQAFDWMMQQRR